MSEQHQFSSKAGAVRDRALRGGDARSRLLRSFALDGLQPDAGYRACVGDAAVTGYPPVVDERLTVRAERRDSLWVMWLTGALDRTTATSLDRGFEARASEMMRLVVDLTGLELVDSSGLEALARMHWRSTRRGGRLSFRYGPHVAQRPTEITRTVRLRSRWAARAAGGSDEDSYFALAMACVNVDHPRSGDRPEAA